MGNVPISCCRSRSPSGSQHASSTRSGNYRDCADNDQHHYSTSHRNLLPGVKISPIKHNKVGDVNDSGSTNRNNQSYSLGHPTHHLQHISEREPDDSETDPSTNPLNRPIFATRSSVARIYVDYNDSCSSENSASRSKQTNTPLMISQDHGYNSTTSTNITHFDGTLNDSFDSNSIQPQQKKSTVNNQFIHVNNDKIASTINHNKLFCMNSQRNRLSDACHQGQLSLPSINKFDSSHEIQQGSKESHRNSLLQKSSSCSTIFIDGSTISQPSLRDTVVCVSLAIYYHIKNRTSDYAADIFDESIHPIKIPISSPTITNDGREREVDPTAKPDEPDKDTVYDFVKTLFKSAELTSEYAITTLIYLERLMTYTDMDLTPKTWRRMFLGAILLSSKVWEDQAVWNVDYAQILEEISVDDINELERQYLEFIQFNMNVPSSIYAKYYFSLRALAERYGLQKDYTLLTVGRATALEAMSRVRRNDWIQSPILRKSTPVKKRHSSLEQLKLSGQAVAVLM